VHVLRLERTLRAWKKLCAAPSESAHTGYYTRVIRVSTERSALHQHVFAKVGLLLVMLCTIDFHIFLDQINYFYLISIILQFNPDFKEKQ
jgi:hypothetical protein